MDTCHRFPCISAGASFLLQGFFRRSVLKFWNIRATLMRFRLNNTLRFLRSVDHMTDSYSFLCSKVCTLLDLSFRMDHCLWEHFLSKVFFWHFVSAAVEQERTIVSSFHAYCRRGGSCPLKAFSSAGILLQVLTNTLVSILSLS